MKRLTAGKWVGIVAIAAGVYRIGNLLLNLRSPMLDEYPLKGLLFLVFFSSLIWVPAAFCVYFGTCLLRNTAKENIRGAVGALIALCILGPVFGISIPYINEEDYGLAHSVLLLAATIVAIPLYMLACYTVVRREGIPSTGYREFFSKIILFLAAWQIFGVGKDLVRRFAPRNPEYPSLSEEPWMSGGFFGSIFLAWAFYRVTVWLVQRGSPVSPGAVHLRGPWQKS